MRQSFTNSLGLISPTTATTTIAASTDSGTWCSSGVSSNRPASTTTTDATVAQPVRAPA